MPTAAQPPVERAAPMKLYHATLKANLGNIKAGGLDPEYASGSLCKQPHRVEVRNSPLHATHPPPSVAAFLVLTNEINISVDTTSRRTTMNTKRKLNYQQRLAIARKKGEKGLSE